MEVGGQPHAPNALRPEKTRYRLYWAPGPVLTGAENLAPTGIRPPDRPGRSEWLYRLSYPVIVRILCFQKILCFVQNKLQYFWGCCTDLFIVGTSQFREPNRRFKLKMDCYNGDDLTRSS
jgi:hypothetical protein